MSRRGIAVNANGSNALTLADARGGHAGTITVTTTGAALLNGGVNAIGGNAAAGNGAGGRSAT
jgi:hypothetical protein